MAANQGLNNTNDTERMREMDSWKRKRERALEKKKKKAEQVEQLVIDFKDSI